MSADCLLCTLGILAICGYALATWYEHHIHAAQARREQTTRRDRWN